jgi:hypothetical protein
VTTKRALRRLNVELLAENQRMKRAHQAAERRLWEAWLERDGWIAEFNRVVGELRAMQQQVAGLSVADRAMPEPMGDVA